MDSMMLFAQACAAGLTVETANEKLLIRGPRSAEPLARALIERKHEILAILAYDDSQVLWRVEVMQRQVPPHGPIFALAARPHLHARGATSRHCRSCGEVMPADRKWHCALCVRAMELALNVVREDVPLDVP